MSEVQALQPIPLSKAKTAYGLLRDVQRVILAEPKRANMGTFATDASDYFDGDTSLAPACGTVGCFAGWVNVLSKGQTAAFKADDTEAKELLGWYLNYELPHGYSVFNAGAGDRCETTRRGSPAHARAVSNRIEGFIKRNLKALKARKLVAAKNGTLSPAPDRY